MTRGFAHEDAFPVIVRLIQTIHRRTGDFVRHDELVGAFLDDGVGRAIVEAARGEMDDKSPEWWASNMIQWFSQRITLQASEYQSDFERTKIDGAWAYKPAA